MQRRPRHGGQRSQASGGTEGGAGEQQQQQQPGQPGAEGSGGDAGSENFAEASGEGAASDQEQWAEEDQAQEAAGEGGATGTAAAAAGASAAFSAAGGGGGGAADAGAGAGFGTVSLARRFQGPGYTFLLAGFLKIMTLGGLAASAPQDVSRTAFGKASGYLLVPVGLGMAWAAKQITDAGLHEQKGFLPRLVAVLVLAYFALVKLLYRADPSVVFDYARRPRARLSGPLADVRAGAGDRELLPEGGLVNASGAPGAGARAAGVRAYRPASPGDKDYMDDLAWYEGRYPDDGAPPGARGGGGGGARAAPRRNARSFLPTADDR